jgi:hypothetical protein
MLTLRIGFVCLVALLAAGCGQRQVSFKHDVFPILQKNCSVCHTPGGPGYVASGFSVMSYQDVMRGTRYGRVIIPGSSISSTLMRLIQHRANPLINMPKNFRLIYRHHEEYIDAESNARRLPARDIKLIKEWINQGAKDN